MPGIGGPTRWASSSESLGEPPAIPHQVAAIELVSLAPGLESLRGYAEVEVRAGFLARVEAGLDRKRVADLLRDLADREHTHGVLDQDDVAGWAEAETNCVAGLDVATGRAGSRGGQQQGDAVPEERQWHEIRRPGYLVGRRHPSVEIMLESIQNVLLALLRSPGGHGHHDVAPLSLIHI